MRKLCICLSFLLLLVGCQSQQSTGKKARTPDSYLAEAEHYLETGDTETAIKVLEEGIEKTGDESLSAKLAELKPEDEEDAAPTNCVQCDAELAEGAKFCTECGSIQGEAVRPEGVPEDAVEWNGHYYYLYDGSIGRDYIEVKNYCMEQGGHLAVIDSKEENDFLYNYMVEQGFGGAYIGYSDAKGSWTWDASEHSDYANLSADAEALREQDSHYAMLRADHTDGTWMIEDGSARDGMTYPIRVTSVTATSYMTEPDAVHVPERAVDGDLSTPWIEGTDDVGIGESITFHFPRQFISSLIISGGYQKSYDLYQANARPHEISLTTDDGTICRYSMHDFLMTEQEVMFDTSVEASSVTLTILSVYPGQWWKDTPISEVSVRAPYGWVGYLCEWPT